VPNPVQICAKSPARLQLVRLDMAGTPLLARITLRSARSLGLAPGQTLTAQIKSVALLA